MVCDKLYNYFNMNSKRIILLTIFLSFFCLVWYPLGLAFADSVSIPNYGPTSFPILLGNIVKYASGLVATLAVIMIVIAGIVYLTSGGGARMETAKKILVYAVAGIVIALAASGIVSTITSIIK